MAFGTALAFFTLFAGSALALMLGDNQFAKDFHWAAPWLWRLSAIPATVCLASARWFRNLFVSQESVTQEATKQEIRDSTVIGDVRMAGRDYHETNLHHDPLASSVVSKQHLGSVFWTSESCSRAE